MCKRFSGQVRHAYLINMDDKFVVPSFFSILEVILTALAVPSFPSSSNDFFQLGVSVGIYLFKFSNINFRTMYEIC